MRLPITRLISTCIPLALAAGALAQDWYVAPGGNDGGAGSPTAPFASIGKGVTVARVDFQRRGSTNASAVTNPGAAVAAPYWVKVVRSGSTIQGWQSADGSAWTQILSDTVAVNATFLIGLAVTSHADGTLASGVFSDIRSSFAPVAAN